MKRGNEKQITKDDADQDEEQSIEVGPGEFAKADSAKISQRRIRKVKKGPKPDTNSDAPNPFVGVTLTAEAATGQPILEVPAGNQQNEGGSTAKAVHDNATVSTPVVGDAGATTGPAAGFASFAAAASPFKQLSEDSIVTADNAGGATPCSQESVFTPPTAQTVAPCPSAPLRKSGTRTFESPPSSVKNAMNSGMTDFGGSSAFKQLAEGGASIFATSQRNAHGFGSPAVFENGVNGGGPKSTPQAWSMSTPSAWDKAKQEDVHEPDSSKPGTSESQAPTITGEESEETVFSHEATLFTLENGGWKSRGKADLRVNACKDAGTARLLMRRKGTLTIFLNAWIYKSMKMSKMGADSCSFTCVNGAEEVTGEKEEQSPGMKVYAIRFPVKGERANMLMSEFLKVVEQFQTKN